MTTIMPVVALILAVLMPALAAEAQPVRRGVRIGILSGANPRSAPWFVTFEQRLSELGYVEGQNVVIEFRNGEGKRERLAEFAAELVRLRLDVIVTSGTAATEAASKATATIPIVQGSGGDLLAAGLIASLARPGGNLTGLSFPNTEVGGKRLQLLKEAVPHASRVAVLWNVANLAKAPEWQDTQNAARALGVMLQSVEVRGPKDLDAAFLATSRARPEALITFADALTIRHRKQIVDFATRQRLPMISELQEFAQTGGLMTYGPSLPDNWRRAATYIDKILKGAKPADLPVEQPTKFELVVNLKTARALGLTIPQSVLIRADHLIR